MSYLPSIRARLESLGYAPMPGILESKNDRWYRHNSSTRSINHVLYLSYKPMAHAYSIGAGVYDADIRSEVESAIPALSSYIEPGVLQWEFFIDRPCWNLFDAGRALQWGILLITPMPRAPETWPDQIDGLFNDFLEPIFFPIRDANDIMELLLRNDRPFEWFMSSPVLRISEIVALGRNAGIQPDILRNRIEQFAAISAKRIPGARFNEAVDKIFDELYFKPRGSGISR